MFSLFDTQLGEVTEIRPARAGLVRIFACGPRVDRYAHLGDLRSYLVADLIRRNGERQGLTVLVCQAVCEVGRAADDGGPPGEDALLVRARAERKPPLEIARFYEDSFRTDCAALNIAPPDYAPRASESAEQVVDQISKLIDAGRAYQSDSGSAYFDAASLPDSERVPGVTVPGATVPGADAARDGEASRSGTDWALWAAAPSGTGLAFDAPWGAGLPSWDAACSALSLGCLGGVIDVHTGDVSLRSGHHAKERALSNSAAGHEVARHWVHCELVLSDGEVVRVADLAGRGLDPLAARLALLEHGYRERMSLTWQALTAADSELRGWRERVADWATEPSRPMCADYWARVRGAFDHDLDTPAALRVLRELAADREILPGSKFETFAAADRVLGLDLVSLVGQPSSSERH